MVIGKELDKSIELLTYLTICHHSLYLNIMSFLLDLGKSTVHRIFVGCAVFLEVLFFNQLNLKAKVIYQKRCQIF